MNSIKNIEKYLNGQMNVQEKEAFELQMKYDPALSQEVSDYQKTLDALKRKWVKNHIQSYAKYLFMRKIVIALIVVAAAATALFTTLNRSGVDQIAGKGSAQLAQANIEDSAVSVNSKTNGIEANTLRPLPPSEHLHVFDSTFTNSSELKDVFKDLNKKEPQTFTINNTKDAECVLKSGTVIKIPAFTLISESGKDHLEKVQLNVTEFSNYYDLWTAGLHTASDDKPLVTGGSCFIEAKTDTENVLVKKDSSYTILFKGKKDKGMRDFYGHWKHDSMFNWSQGTSTENYQSVSRSSVKILPKPTKSDTIFYLEPVVVDEGKINGDYTYKTLANAGCFENVFDTFKHSNVLDLKRMLMNKQNLLFRFHLMPNGDLDRYDYNFQLKRKQEKAIKGVAHSVLGKSKVDVKDFVFDERIVNVTLFPRVKIVTEEVDVSDEKLSKAKEFKEAEEEYNAITSSFFGYVNCDRFMNYTYKTDMKVHSEIGALQDLRVFFKKESCVMPASIKDHEALVKNIPENEDVLVLGISVDGKTMFIQNALTKRAIYSGKGEKFDAVKIKKVLSAYY